MIDLSGMASRRHDEEMLPLLVRHEIQVLRRAGHSQADVARRTAVSIAAVRRVERENAVKHADDVAARRDRSIGRPSKAAPFADSIRKWLADEPALPTLELLRRAREAGYEGHKSAFYALAAGLRPPRAAPIVRFEGVPGEFSQHDFGEVDVTFVDGRRKRIHFFASRLKFSRFAQVTLVPDQKTETLIRTLVRHFVGFGGVPLLAVFDRPRTIVHKGGKGRDVASYNPTFAQAVLDIGVGIEMCAPRSGNQKGSVERIVGWVKGSFFKVRRFMDEQDLDAQLGAWLVEINTRVPSRATGIIPETRRLEELARLRPVKVVPERLALRIPIVVGPTAEVIHDAVAYSMPPSAANVSGTLFLYEDHVHIVAGRFEASHRRRRRGDPPAPLPEHRAAKVAAVHGRRAKLYEKRQQILNLGPDALSFVTEVVHRTPKHHTEVIERLFALLQDYGDDAVRDALRRAVLARSFTARAVTRHLRASSAARRRRLEEPARRVAQPRGPRSGRQLDLPLRPEPRGGRS